MGASPLFLPASSLPLLPASPPSLPPPLTASPLTASPPHCLPLSLPPPSPFSLPLLPAVFTTEELESALRPVFDAVWDQDPESYPFRQPVDPRALGIPVRELRRQILHRS